VKMLLQ